MQRRSSTSPLTKYFQIIPQKNKENVMPTGISSKGPRRKRSSGIDYIDISSDEECHSKKRIKDLFDDSVETRQQFPPADRQLLPYYLRDKSPHGTSSDSGSDVDLPPFTLHTSTPSPCTLPSFNDRIAPPPFDIARSPLNKLDDFSKCTKSSSISSVSSCFNEPSCCDDEISETAVDVLEETLESLLLIETKLDALEAVVGCRGLVKSCDKVDSVGVYTHAQEKYVEHYLTLTMATPAKRLSSTIGYLRTITTRDTIPSGTCLNRIWKFMLENEINDLVVLQHAVTFFTSLLLLHPLLSSTQAREQYSIFIKLIKTDLLDLLKSDEEWKIVLLETVVGLLLLDYKDILTQDSLIDKDSPLFLQVFWPTGGLHHVNNTAQSFVKCTIDVLVSDISLLMIRRLELCGQFLFLIHSQCDISHELSLHYQQMNNQSSITSSKKHHLLSALHPLSLVSAIHKSSMSIL